MSQFFRVASLVTFAAAALAPVAASAADGFSFNVGAVTDYRYRGLSQSRLEPAVQGGADFAQGGLYAGVWASTIKWTKDSGGGGDVEVDLYGGYKGSVNKDLSFDVGALTYQYPSNGLDKVQGFVDATTYEVYGALTFGPVTAKYSHSVSNLFGNPDSKNSGYADLSGSFEWEGLSLVPHIGYQDISGPNGNFSYTDYSFTVSKDFNGLVVSGALIGTDIDINLGGENIGKPTFVLGVKYNF
jgi:uncharacterized protein (TIGR02001 family)